MLKRVFNLTRTQHYLLLGLAAALVVGASYVYWGQVAPARQAVIIEPPATAGDSDQGEGQMQSQEPKREPEEVVVHVAGAVVKSGVYRLPEGSRVVDAVAVAGGAGEEADLDAVNLAQPLIDGQKVWLPKLGEQDGSSMVDSASGVADSKVNINTAGLTELQTLNGIGPSLAQRIIDYRTDSGPFQRIEDIQNVTGIGEKRFLQLKDHITVY